MKRIISAVLITLLLGLGFVVLADSGLAYAYGAPGDHSDDFGDAGDMGDSDSGDSGGDDSGDAESDECE